MSEIPEQKPNKIGRNLDGTLAKGHPPLPGVGRPKGALSAGIMKLTQEFLEEDDNGKTRAENILIAMYSKAKDGDGQSAKLIFDRAYGQAKEQAEITVSVDPRETAFGKWLKDFGGEPVKPEAK